MRSPCDLELPESIAAWIGSTPISDTSGESGAKTYYVDCPGGAYLKIDEKGALKGSFVMHKYFSGLGLTSKVVDFVSGDRDYLLMAVVEGFNGISPQYLCDPERLSMVFGQALRMLHNSSLAVVKMEGTQALNQTQL